MDSWWMGRKEPSRATVEIMERCGRDKLRADIGIYRQTSGVWRDAKLDKMKGTSGYYRRFSWR